MVYFLPLLLVVYFLGLFKEPALEFIDYFLKLIFQFIISNSLLHFYFFLFFSFLYSVLSSFHYFFMFNNNTI